MKRSLLFTGGSVVAAVGVVTACQAIDGIHVYEYNPDTSVQYADGPIVYPDVQTIIVKPDAAVCNRAALPEGPDAASITSLDQREYVIAMSRFSFTGNGQASIGYDLDFTCTGEQGTSGPPGPSSCLTPDGGMAPDDTSSVSGLGVDAVLSTGTGGLQQFFNGSLDSIAGTEDAIDQGLQTLIFIIDDYNGLPDDAQVSLTAVTSEWVQATGCAPPDPATTKRTHPTPLKDGCDVWSLKKAIDGGAPVVYTTGDAYVVGGKLVANFLVGVPVELGEADFTPISPHIVANLAFSYPDAGDGGVGGGVVQDSGILLLPDGGDGRILNVTDGLMQGILSSRSFLDALGYIQDPLGANMAGICPGSLTYGELYTALCNTLDINSTGNFSGTGNCDAFSFAAAFDAVTIRKGLPQGVPITSFLCDGGTPEAAGVVDCPFALP